MTFDRTVVVWLVVAAGSLLLISALTDVLLPFAAGAAIAYVLSPVLTRLEAAGLGRVTAATLIVVGALAVLGIALVVVVPLAAEQLKQLALALPEDLRRLRATLDAWASERPGSPQAALAQSLKQALSTMAGSWTDSASALLQQLFRRGMALINLLSLLLVTPIVAFYLLVDWPRMIARIDSWLPRAHAPTIRRLAGEIDIAVASFLRGQGIICLIAALFLTLGLWLIGLRYSLLIGLIAGLMSFVPVVGSAAGALMAGIAALVQAWPDPTLFAKVLAVFAAFSALDTLLLSPRLIGERLGLHPVWLLLALSAFTSLFGLVGALIAVPLAAITAVLGRHALDLYLQSELYATDVEGQKAAGQPDEPGSTPREPPR